MSPPDRLDRPTALLQQFYARPVLEVARDLIGCGFFFRGIGGRIVEAEAYGGEDPCSHGYRGRTQRNSVMFGPPGHLYVYFTYGMHFCCNLVCEDEGVGAAVLLRAIEPTAGIEVMARRRGLDPKLQPSRVLCGGPARLTQALAIGRAENGLPAWEAPLIVAPRGPCLPVGCREGGDVVAAPNVMTTVRIGVGDDRKPWRFVDADSPFLSRPLAREPRRAADGRSRAVVDPAGYDASLRSRQAATVRLPRRSKGRP